MSAQKPNETGSVAVEESPLRSKLRCDRRTTAAAFMSQSGDKRVKISTASPARSRKKSGKSFKRDDSEGKYGSQSPAIGFRGIVQTEMRRTSILDRFKLHANMMETLKANDRIRGEI